jgi:hypothetical protein
LIDHSRDQAIDTAEAFPGQWVYTVPMLNIWLTLGYFAVVGTVVVSRDSFLDNDLAVAGVAALVLFLGLGLWLFVAQSYRDEGYHDDGYRD